MSGPVAIDAARFVHETVDGETVMLDTVGGQLLLLHGSAPLLLDALNAGFSPPALLREIAARYGVEAAAGTDAWLDAMTQAGVLIEAADPPPLRDAMDWPADFAIPEFERYDDIADIVTLDPIHEVDQLAGWPKRPPTAHP